MLKMRGSKWSESCYYFPDSFFDRKNDTQYPLQSLKNCFYYKVQFNDSKKCELSSSLNNVP